MDDKASVQTSAGSGKARRAREWPCRDGGQRGSRPLCPSSGREHQDTVCSWGGYLGWPWQGDMERGVSLAQEQGDHRDSVISS